MKICLDHWSLMRAEISRAGLSSFVSECGEDSVARTERNLMAYQDSEKPLLSDWDPLMSMTWNFYSRVMARTGLRIMGERHWEEDGMPENGGHVCPLCVVKRDFDAHNTGSGRCGTPGCEIQVKSGDMPWDQNWITDCTAVMVEYALEQKLIIRQ